MSASEWSYRVIRMVGINTKTNTPFSFYEVHEIYYDKYGKPDALTVESISPSGETIPEFMWSWRKYRRAFSLPVLVYDVETEKFQEKEEPPLVSSPK